MASEFVWQMGEASSLVKNRQSIAHLTGGKQFPSSFSDKIVQDPANTKVKEHSVVLIAAAVLGLYLLLK